MIKEIILAGAMLLPQSHNHNAGLAYLQKRLAKEGYDISNYIKDPRFKINEPLGKSSPTNYAKDTWYMRPDSLEKCADFIEENWTLLYRAEKDFGASPEHITSQLQLESNKGQNPGTYRAFNAMTSQYLHRTGKKKEEFYKYLREYLRLCADTTDNILLSSDVFENMSSRAGAIGIAQVMSYNMDSYLIDYNKDGKREPLNLEDAVGTIARFIGKNRTQAYNPGDFFYESSIGMHTDSLENIMERRSRIPPKKILNYPKIPTIILEPVKYDKLEEMKPVAIMPQLPKKQPLRKKRLFNRRIRKR